jgi:AraC-like DNA-binding protein
MSESLITAEGSAQSASPPSTDGVDTALVALERMDVEAFVEACRALGSTDDRPVPPPLSSLRLYELLRAAGETLDGRGSTQQLRQERARWAAMLDASSDPRERHRVFFGEIERLVGPYRRKQSPINPTVLRALRFIETHATERISLSRVAKEVGLARNYMSSLFHRETGVTMTEYIHRVRIRRAVSLLQGGALPMTEVAKLVGYGSYRHFHRRFSRLLAVSPTTYQREPASPAAVEALVPKPRH